MATVKTDPKSITMTDQEFSEFLAQNKDRLVKCLEAARLKAEIIASSTDQEVLDGLGLKIKRGSIALANEIIGLIYKLKVAS